MPLSPAISATSTAAPLAGIRASFISPSASGVDWASPRARRSMWCGWMQPAAASWWVRASRCGWIASRCAMSTGSATARSTARSARVWRFSCGCDRPARRSRRGCAPPMAAMKSNWSRARRAYPPARLACFTTHPQARRACSAAASSKARPRRAHWPKSHCGHSRWSRPCADKKFQGGGMAADIDRAGVAKAYERWAPIYDLVFGKVFEHGRQSTIAEADKIGGRILDVGVGTGLSLSDYPPTTRLCGVDISEAMLRKAQSRVRALGLKNVETLAVMDARNLAFADSSFDAVVAQYVITAVPDPEATLDDFIRVRNPVASSFWSITSAPRAVRAASSNWRSRRWRGGSAGGRNFHGRG